MVEVVDRGNLEYRLDKMLNEGRLDDDIYDELKLHIEECSFEAIDPDNPPMT